MNPYASLVRTLGRTRGFSWLASRVVPPLDRRFAGRRRSLTSLGTGFPLCYLTVRGRRSGEEHTVPLLYVGDGERVVLIGSNWGRERDPAWALNLAAAGEATVTVAGVSRRMASRRATTEETARYWPRALEVWPGWEGYRRRAARELPMFVLNPLEAPRLQSGAPDPR